MESGSTGTADHIPDDICILWDSSDYTPGSGWTEITDKNERFIFVDSTNAPGSTSDAIGISGATISNFTSRDYRVFKKNNTTTEYEFPIGSIIVWDQTTPPTGYVAVDADGIYLNINSVIDADDSHVFDTSVSGTGAANNIENILSVYLIKKVGEADTWDGLSHYCYALYYAATAPAHGWTDVTSTYTDHYMRGKSSGAPETTLGGATQVTIDWVQQASHSYTGGGTGTLGHDGDFTTSQTAEGAGSHTIVATHLFDVPKDVTQVKYKLYVYGYAYGDDSASASGYWKLEYLNSSDVWTTIASDGP
jgi:hypothetical protein